MGGGDCRRDLIWWGVKMRWFVSNETCPTSNKQKDPAQDYIYIYNVSYQHANIFPKLFRSYGSPLAENGFKHNQSSPTAARPETNPGGKQCGVQTLGENDTNPKRVFGYQRGIWTKEVNANMTTSSRPRLFEFVLQGAKSIVLFCDFEMWICKSKTVYGMANIRRMGLFYFNSLKKQI